MIDPFLTLIAICLLPIWGAWAFRKSMREGAVTYKGTASHHNDEPLAFWISIFLICFGGFIAPAVLIIVEFDRLTAFLSALW